jgi:hypothetical protein
MVCKYDAHVAIFRPLACGTAGILDQLHVKPASRAGVKFRND